MKLYRTLLRILAVTAVVYLCVDVGYRALRLKLWRPHSRPVSTGAAPRPAAEPEGRLEAYDIIVKRNLFDAALRHAEPDTDAMALQPTTLKVALLGTVTGPRGRSFAVIEETDKKKQGLYRVGDPVQNAFVKEILRGKVILRIDGRDEVLEIQKRPAAPGKSQPSPAPSRESQIVVKRAELKRSLARMNDLLTELRIRPHLQNGKDRGFSVLWIKPDSFFLKMGLKDGDIIQGFNDRSIESPDDMLALYQDLKAGSPIALRIVRRGKPTTLNYRFE